MNLLRIITVTLAAVFLDFHVIAAAPMDELKKRQRYEDGEWSFYPAKHVGDEETVSYDACDEVAASKKLDTSGGTFRGAPHLTNKSEKGFTCVFSLSEEQRLYEEFDTEISRLLELEEKILPTKRRNKDVLARIALKSLKSKCPASGVLELDVLDNVACGYSTTCRVGYKHISGDGSNCSKKTTCDSIKKSLFVNNFGGCLECDLGGRLFNPQSSDTLCVVSKTNPQKSYDPYNGKPKPYFWVAASPTFTCRSEEGEYQSAGLGRQMHLQQFQHMRFAVKQPTYVVLQDPQDFTGFYIIANSEKSCAEGVSRAKSIGR